ncbi:MAG: WYL domain-containing protein [Oscillospiraceae bacterium]|nr:WYL domain-containing protein [Oscillospiraceae bacterium]
MARSANQKLKILYIAKILTEYTDEENHMKTQEILDALARYDISADRKSIYSDIEALRQYGLDIENKPGPGGGYYIASRDFELPELKLLVDAVQSSRLITGKKSRELIEKLSKLTSISQGKQLNRQVVIGERIKPLNETVYYSIDAIHAAINEGKKISFKYFEYDRNKRRIYRRNNEAYVRTPIAMCWNEDKYYLVTYNPMYENPIAPFRVDRMTNVTVLDEIADVYDKKKYNISDFIKRTFGMFSGETVLARLAFDESLVSVILDYFGAQTIMIPTEGDRFIIDVEVSNSPVFLAWMFQFGEKSEIISPDSLREAMGSLIQTGSDIYKK